MARPLRIEYEGALYHVTSRGNAQQAIFLDDADRTAFLEVLTDVVERFGWLCHAYCLMTNHYHLLIETPEANLSRGMRQLNGVYTQAFNRRHGRVGHVMQGRFKAILVEKESHLLELTRYVVLNPVRAGTVRSAHDWPWSSYRATCGQAEVPCFLTVDWTRSQFDDDEKRAVLAYRRFVQEGRGRTAWDDLQHGVFLGSDKFVEELKPLLKERSAWTEIPREQRLAVRPSLSDLFAEVRDRTDRNERIHDAVRLHEYTLKEVGDFLGLHYSTISVIAKRVAEARKHKK
jgi:REP element-mobilizing transposase RayT